jgi:hypothetical protein
MLSKEMQKYVDEFYNDDRYETLIEELTKEDENLCKAFEKLMSKIVDEETVNDEEVNDEEMDIPMKEMMGGKKNGMQKEKGKKVDNIEKMRKDFIIVVKKNRGY